MLLHQDRQQVAFLVDVGELLAEAEQRFVGVGSGQQTDAVDVRRIGRGREAQVGRGQRFEGQPEADAAPAAGQPAAHRDRRAVAIERIDGGAAERAGYRVVDAERALRGTDVLHPRRGGLGHQEIAAGGRLPQDAAGRVAVRHLQTAGGAGDEEVAGRVGGRLRPGGVRHRRRGQFARAEGEEMAPLHDIHLFG